MKTAIFTLLFCIALVGGGCADKEKERELQAQIDRGTADRTTLQTALTDREQFVEEILKSVNDIYADLEKARVKEGTLKPGGIQADEAPWVSSPDSRTRILKNIGEIGTSLADNRKKIGDLQVRVKKYRGEVANLTSLIEKLKTSLQEREESIAQLKANVQGLEKSVAEQTQIVREREVTIEQQKKDLSTVFYIAGTRKELEEKGIIHEEGGFLWGLLGSTTTMTIGVDDAEFIPMDRNAMESISVNGKIDEILPHRKPDYYATAETGEGSTKLNILAPQKFWQGNHLVVVLD